MKCPTCRTRVSGKWLILGMPWSKYTCNECNSVYAGTISRFVINTLAVGVVGYFVIRIVKGKSTALFLPLLFGLLLALLFEDLPGMIKKVGDAAEAGNGHDR